MNLHRVDNACKGRAVDDDRVSNECDAPVASFTSSPRSSTMASRVATRSFRAALSLTKQNKLSPSLVRSKVSVAPESGSTTKPKQSATAADLTAEDLGPTPSRRNANTTTTNGNGDRTVTNNNGHSWTEGSGDGSPFDWSRSFHGLSSQPFDKEITEILLAPVVPTDIEMKPGTSLCCNLIPRI